MNNAEEICLALLSNCKNLKSVKQIQAFATKNVLISDPFVAGKLLLHCAVNLSGGALDYARRLLIHTPNADVFMHNTLIRGQSDSDSPESSISTFRFMITDSGVFPDSFSFVFTLKAAANMRCLISGFQIHCQAFIRGFHTHPFVGTTLINMYGECGSIVMSRKVFDEIPDPNVVTWNAILAAYFRCGDVKGAEEMYSLMPLKNLTSYNLMLAGYTRTGDVEAARHVFREMPMRNDVAWSTMITGFAEHGYFDEAVRLFRELTLVGDKPNEVNLTGLLSASAQAGALEFAKSLHGLVQKAGLDRYTAVSNALIVTYSKCGILDMARLVFGTMPGTKSIITWTSMILGLGMQGYGEKAVSLFHEMEGSGIRVDGIAFISVLYACSHSGLIEQGCEIFDRMTNMYGIEPTIEHYGCMVDLYARAGQLQKAYDCVIEMPIKPNDVIWRTLLGACSFFGNLDLAEQVKERLKEMDPNNYSDNVLLSNVYAVAGKWGDVATLRRSMATLKMKKTPGWSVIEVDKVMYTFVAGTKRDEITEEAHEKLREIMLKLRAEASYVPQVGSVLHDIEEEEKEDALVTHSEKLAVAFGMARLCEGRIIRIVKNLRVCKDCHTVMKLISQVYESEIVLRDRSRFHSFKDGVCSCRDYW